MERDRKLIDAPAQEVAEHRNRYGSAAYGHSKLVSFEVLDDTPGPPETSGAGIDTLRLLRARAWIIAVITLICGVVGAALTLLEAPIYQAKTTMQISAPVENAVGILGGPAALAYAPPLNLQTQVKVLESRTLRQRAIASLKAQNRLSLYTSADSIAPVRRLLGFPPAKAGPRVYGGIPPFEARVHSFDGTDVVEIVCDSPDPNFSADYVNAAASEFIQLSLESKWSGYQRTSGWLTRQLAEMKGKLEASEQDLQAYGERSKLQFRRDKDSVQSDKLKQVQEELSRAQADRVAKQSVFEVAMGSAADTVPQVIDNERLSGYQTKLAEMRRELAELGALYTPEHYKVVRMQAQILEVEATLKNERNAVLSRIRNDYEAAQRREKLLLADYVAQSQTVTAEAAKAIHYDVLQRDVDTNRQLYDALLQRVKEASVTSALASSNMQVLDQAEPPSLPYKPSLVSNLLKGLGAGILLGMFLVVSADRINQSLRAPGETAFHLKVPELGVIPSSESLLVPRFAASRAKKAPNAPAFLPLDSGRSPERVELATWQDSNSLLAESFRNTLASILLTANGNRPRVILVTSAFRDEGKSTAVSNFGIGLAEINQRILLIDADMRKPRLHQIFELSNSWGLSDLLREKSVLRDSPIEALAQPTQIAGLWLLPSGPGTLSISNLLYSERMAQLLERFRTEFDTILIDTPPMLTISDARILGRLADGAVLVIRAGRTTRDAAMRAKERLVEDGIPVLGTVLNRWDSKSKTRYGNYGYPQEPRA